MPVLTVFELSPDSIRFTQDSISGCFRNGQDIWVTYEVLLYQRITPYKIDSIEVFRRSDGLYWAGTGNRRLYLYKKLRALGVIDKIPVREGSFLNNSNTTDCNGVFTRCRQSYADAKISEITEKWRAAKGLQAVSISRPLH